MSQSKKFSGYTMSPTRYQIKSAPNIMETIPNGKEKIINNKRRISSDVILKIIKCVGVTLSLWPLDSDATKFRIRIYHFIWWFNVLNFSLVFLPLLIETCNVRKNTMEFPIAWMELVAITECLIGYATSRIQKNRLKILLNSVSDLFYCGDDRKKSTSIDKNLAIFTKCIYIVCGSYMILIFSYVIDGTINSSEGLIIKTSYPFPTEVLSVKITILIHQTYVTFASLSLVILDSMCCLIMYSAITRLDILAEDYEKAQNYSKLLSCVRNHQDLICYVKEIVIASRIIIIKAVLAYMGYFISAGFCLMQVDMGWILIKPFIAVLLTASARLLVYAYTAEKVKEKHKFISLMIYNGKWYQYEKKMIDILVIIKQRCQKPIKISYSIFFQPLSIRFFSQYVYRSFSYLMALLTIQKKMQN